MKDLIRKILKEEVENLSEDFKKSNDTFPPFIRFQLEKIYKPIGMWGQAPNPNDDCDTNVGVINIFPHSEQDVWSVLNRFDTNTKVKNRLKELFELSGIDGRSDQDFRKWIEDNRDDLFGPNGTYSQELVDLNMTTIVSGNRNEEYAVNELRNKFPNTVIKRFCAGDKRDTRQGIDIVIEYPNKSINIQVKPFVKVDSYVELDGDTFFEVKSMFFEPNKYSERNVSTFMFVNVDEDKYILFKNNKTKIGQMRNHITRFYEPYLYTNINFEESKQKKNSKSLDHINDVFDVKNNTLKNLEFRKNVIEKMIKKIKLEI
jgi:hypothetical protein